MTSGVPPAIREPRRRRVGRFSRETIGPPDCPILYRWTLFGNDERDEEGNVVRRYPVKFMVHHFLLNADDRDVHDHPRPFWTFVLWGGYDDMEPCRACLGT